VQVRCSDYLGLDMVVRQPRQSWRRTEELEGGRGRWSIGGWRKARRRGGGAAQEEENLGGGDGSMRREEEESEAEAGQHVCGRVVGRPKRVCGASSAPPSLAYRRPPGDATL
jgi:hypothetical protein